MRKASWMLTIPSGSFSGPFKRTSGAMISRFRRCLRSALGVRRSAKVAISIPFSGRQGTEPDKPSLVRPSSNQRLAEIGQALSDSLGDVTGDLLREVCQWHHTEVL